MRDGQRVPLSVEPQASGRNGYGGDFDSLPELARRWMMPAPPVRRRHPRARAPMPRSRRRHPQVPPRPCRPSLLRRQARRPCATSSSSTGCSAAATRVWAWLSPTWNRSWPRYLAVKDGVLVTSVTSGSTAAKAGVKAGDVITSLNGATVSSPADLRQRAAPPEERR